MSRTVLPTCAVAALLLALLGGAPPTTAPSARLRLDPAIRLAYARLADVDPVVRDKAREQLMGLSRDDLAKLLDVVRAAGPPVPDQAAVLRDVVCHAYLVAEPYAGAGDPVAGRPMYFMGVRCVPDGPRLGVPVAERWPGFPAYRCVRDGDMILGVYLTPPAPGLLRMLTTLAAHSTPSRPLEIMSLLRPPYRFGGFVHVGPANPHSMGLGVDIAAYGGHAIRQAEPETCVAAVLALLRDLPPGRYRLGMPKALEGGWDLPPALIALLNQSFRISSRLLLPPLP